MLRKIITRLLPDAISYSQDVFTNFQICITKLHKIITQSLYHDAFVMST